MDPTSARPDQSPADAGIQLSHDSTGLQGSTKPIATGYATVRERRLGRRVGSRAYLFVSAPVASANRRESGAL
jgi:hypothetical protein